MKFKSILTIGIFSLLLSSCFILEREVTMRKFNHIVKTEKYSLQNPVEAILIYNPKIDFEVSNKALFLKNIDSVFVGNFKSKLIEKLANSNINCTENNNSGIKISIDNIYFHEEIVNRSYTDDAEDKYTLENSVVLRIEYTVYKNPSDKGTKMKNYIYNETVTNKNLLLGLEIEKKNTFQLGLAEDNLLQMAANDCAMYLNGEKKK